MGAKRPLRSCDKQRIGLTPYFRCQIGCKGTKNILNIQQRILGSAMHRRMDGVFGRLSEAGDEEKKEPPKNKKRERVLSFLAVSC